MIRISGGDLSHIAQQITGRALTPRRAHYVDFRDADGQTIDSGIALYFPAPNSFTGQDVLELQGHGGAVVLDMMLQRAITAGARLARAGEFSERAFLNDKMDLLQAEAVADLISAASAQQARQALASLQGEFSTRVAQISGLVDELRIYLEASLDFPEEDIDLLQDTEFGARVEQLDQLLSSLLDDAEQGSRRRNGISVVLAGAPNVGKSSLLNRLAREERAIVTDIAGTTRDILSTDIVLDGVPVRVLDTAGLRQSSDVVEQEGVNRALQALSISDRILYVVEAGVADTQQQYQMAMQALGSYIPLESLPPVTLIRNKIDRLDMPSAVHDLDGRVVLDVSALNGDGLDRIRSHLLTCAGIEEGGSAISARTRHVVALKAAAQGLEAAQAALRDTGVAELVAEDLRTVRTQLAELVGTQSADELLGEIFSSFCIGK